MTLNAQDWIENHTRTIEPLHRDSAVAIWNASVTGLKEHEEESARLDSAIRTLYSDRSAYDAVRKLEAGSKDADPLIARQLLLLRLTFLSNQSEPEVIRKIVGIEKALESTFNNFRAELGGEKVGDNRLREIMRAENDSTLRQAAWEASKQIGPLAAARVRELAALRNTEARRLGFRDHFAMSLELQELEEGRLFRTFEDLYRLSEEPFSRYKDRLDQDLARRFGVSPATLRPWHYADPFFQEAPSAGLPLDQWFEGRALEPLAVGHFKGMGLEVDDVLARSDLYEKPGKSQHAFCISIDRGQDVRILCNLESNERWMETLLHELGHAVYDKYLDRSLPYVLRTPAHTLTTEAIAMLNGRFTRSAEWLARRAGVPESEALEMAGRLERRVGEQILLLTRWTMVMTYFERDLYADPDQDLDTLWWDHVEHFQELTRPEKRHAPDWAAKIHVALAPVYYQNYLLGEMMASQLGATLATHLPGDKQGLNALVDRREAGEFLRRHVFEPGARYPWEELLTRATGEGLNPEHFVRQYPRD